MSFLDDESIGYIERNIRDSIEKSLKANEPIVDRFVITSNVTDESYFLFDAPSNKSYSILVNRNKISTLPAKIELPAIHNNKPVTHIYIGGFANISVLESVTLPSSIVKISDYAFLNCTNLREVTISAPAVPEIGKNIFDNTSEDLVIYVAKDLVDKYKEDYGWSCYSDYIKPLPWPEPAPNLGSSANNGVVNVAVPTIVNSNNVTINYLSYYFNFSRNEKGIWEPEKDEVL